MTGGKNKTSDTFETENLDDSEVGFFEEDNSMK
jgi:hypothetical protein